jgi:hypothetical protein
MSVQPSQLRSTSKNICLVLRVDVIPKMCTYGSDGKAFVPIVGVSHDGHRQGIVLFNEATEQMKDWVAKETYTFSGGMARVRTLDYSMSTAPTGIDVAFDKFCKIRVSEQKVDTLVPIKTIEDMTSSSGQSIGDVLLIVSEVVGMKTVLRKKDGTPIDRFVLRCASKSGIIQVSFWHANAMECSRLQLTTGDIIYIQGLRVQSYRGGFDASVGKGAAFGKDPAETELARGLLEWWSQVDASSLPEQTKTAMAHREAAAVICVPDLLVAANAMEVKDERSFVLEDVSLSKSTGPFFYLGCPMKLEAGGNRVCSKELQPDVQDRFYCSRCASVVTPIPIAKISRGQFVDGAGDMIKITIFGEIAERVLGMEAWEAENADKDPVAVASVYLVPEYQGSYL